MAKKKKKTKTKELPSINFSKPIEYTYGTFGGGNSSMSYYKTNIKVSDLKSDFSSFEEMRNVSKWPVSKIIQRELKRSRAKDIANTYISDKSKIHFFPPLIAVLLPLDDEYIPMESFESEKEEETIACDNFLKSSQPDRYKDFEEIVCRCAGIYEKPYDEYTGDIVWNQNNINCVVIDGQHRRASLLEASKTDRQILDWKVEVIIVDLVKAEQDLKQSPISIVRTLFTDINNTPETVDDARIYLMDDSDIVAAFAQCLVNDDSSANLPAVPPELIDWHCKSGKHSSTNSLTGISTLYHILHHVFMDGNSLVALENKSSLTKVKKWADKVESRLELEKELVKMGPEFSLKTILKSLPMDDDGYDECVNFNYPRKTHSMISSKFEELYLPVFRETFNNLEPFKYLHQLAKNNFVFTQNSIQSEYYRGTLNKREDIRKKDELDFKTIKKYESEFEKTTDKNIVYTVMGQKAIFNVLFNYGIWITEVDELESKKLSSRTSVFIEDFNDFYAMYSAKNIDTKKQFFNLNYSVNITSLNEVYSTAVQFKKFWVGFILSESGQIDYSKTAVNILSLLLEYTLLLSYDMQGEDKLPEIRKAIIKLSLKRHNKIFLKINDNEALAEQNALKTINGKLDHIKNLVKKITSTN